MSVVMGPSFEGKILASQLYHRHRKWCKAGRSEDSKSGNSRRAAEAGNAAPF
jgi:hypothetical protein